MHSNFNILGVIHTTSTRSIILIVDGALQSKTVVSNPTNAAAENNVIFCDDGHPAHLFSVMIILTAVPKLRGKQDLLRRGKRSKVKKKEETAT